MMDADFIRRGLEAGPDCPRLHNLAHQMSLPIDTTERRQAEQHVKSCPHCWGELAISREFEAGAPREDEKESVRWIAAQFRLGDGQGGVRRPLSLRLGGWRPARKTSLIAAAFTVAAGLMIVMGIRPEQPAAVGEQGEVLRAEPLRAVAPLGDLKAVPDEFRWTAIPGAARYVLTVAEVDRTVLFQLKTQATAVPIPESVRELMNSRTMLLWSVTAQDRAGRELGRSGVQRFRLQPFPLN
jgi:hypothetical protein